MARKTKEEAEMTRQRLLDAAERVFHARGVSRSSLEDVAREAGLTRGAIYWHFKDKAALFEAVLARAVQSFEGQLAQRLAEVAEDAPARRVFCRAMLVLQVIATQSRERQVFEIIQFKMERLEQLVPLFELWEREMVRCAQEMRVDMARALPQASAQEVDRAVRGLDALLHGLLRKWGARPQEFDLVGEGAAIVRTHLRGLGLSDI